MDANKYMRSLVISFLLWLCGIFLILIFAPCTKLIIWVFCQKDTLLIFWIVILFLILVYHSTAKVHTKENTDERLNNRSLPIKAWN